MSYYLEKEYHPVIEDFISSYTENDLSTLESEVFEELLFQDDDLRELTFAAIAGKQLLDKFRKSNDVEKFAVRLLKNLRE